MNQRNMAPALLLLCSPASMVDALPVRGACDNPFLDERRCQRIAWVQVGDQSDFVNSFSKTLSELGPKIGAALNENHFRFFCDKLANSLAPRFFEAIFRCRKIGEAGSQQLLLDTQAIKGLLLEFPTAGKSLPFHSPTYLLVLRYCTGVRHVQALLMSLKRLMSFDRALYLLMHAASPDVPAALACLL